MVTGFDTLIDALNDHGVTQITMIDAPAVLGWDEWRARGEKYGLGVIEALLRRAIEAGAIEPQPVRPIAHIMLGALDEAVLYVSRAAHHDAARDESAR